MHIPPLLVAAILGASPAPSLYAQNAPATGPLRPLASNPRWFTDGTGRAVLLAGSHTWQNLQDNVLFEIVIEAGPYSTTWQYSMITYIKQYEATQPKQHAVGMTFQYRGGTNSVLHESPADWISPNPGDSARSYTTNPCADCSPKVVVSDTDHLWGHTGGDNI